MRRRLRDDEGTTNTRGGDDNSLDPAAAPTCPHSRCSPQVPQPSSLQCPGLIAPSLLTQEVGADSGIEDDEATTQPQRG